MRFLADENLEHAVIVALQEAGHDVGLIPDPGAGTRDRDVLARANEEQRILLTNDKDFAELAFLQRQVSAGIVLIRMPASTSSRKAERVRETVRIQADRLSQAMTVVEETATRRRPFPRRLPRRD